MITSLFEYVKDKFSYVEKSIFNEGVSIPVRFSGNKKLWQEFIEKKALELPENATVVDAFGGSGIISYYITKIRPDIKVIYNDFDNYLNRVEHIEDLEQVRKDLQKICGKRTHGTLRKNNGLDKNPIDDEKKSKIIKYLNKRKDKNLFTDYNVITTWLTHGFSARDEISEDLSLVNGIPVDPLNIEYAKEYYNTLKPLKTKFDIRNLNKSKRLQNLLHDTSVYWVLDPPYRETDCYDYKNEFSQEIEDAIKEIIKTNRVMLFCDKKEVSVYKQMFKKKPKTKNKEKHSFYGSANRVESCIYSW